MKKTCIFLIFLLMVIFSASCNTKSTENITRMDGSRLETILNDETERGKYLIIDVREDYEYKAGHVPHSIRNRKPNFRNFRLERKKCNCHMPQRQKKPNSSRNFSKTRIQENI